MKENCLTIVFINILKEQSLKILVCELERMWDILRASSFPCSYRIEKQIQPSGQEGLHFSA